MELEKEWTRNNPVGMVFCLRRWGLGNMKLRMGQGKIQQANPVNSGHVEIGTHDGCVDGFPPSSALMFAPRALECGILGTDNVLGPTWNNHFSVLFPSLLVFLVCKSYIEV